MILISFYSKEMIFLCKGYERTIFKHNLHAPDVDYSTLKANEKTRWIDGDGYQYYLSRANLSCTDHKNGSISKFFNGNIYTEHNVRLYADRVSCNDIVVINFQANNAHDKIQFYTKKHGYEFSKSFNEFTRSPYVEKRNTGYVSKRRHTIEYIAIEALNMFNITIISERYVNNTTPMLFRCNCDGHGNEIQSMSWAQMISKKRPCKICSVNQSRHLVEQTAKSRFENALSESQSKNPDIDVVGAYTSSHNKIKCVCKRCGRNVYLRPDHILNGIGCGKCTKSLGERLVEYCLREMNIDFIPQYRMVGCRHKRPLPFDFFLPLYNAVIEFDGIQHFLPSDAFGGIEEFENQKIRDEIKSDYCAQHGIALIRISHEQISDISKILNEALSSVC